MEILIIIFIVAFMWRILRGDNGDYLTVTNQKKSVMKEFVFVHKTDKKATPINIMAFNLESAKAKLGVKSIDYKESKPKEREDSHAEEMIDYWNNHH